MSTKIGIIGSGAVAKTLGKGLHKHGYDVLLGTRDTAKLNDWKNEHPGINIGSFEDAARYGDIVILAVKGHAALDVLKLAGIRNFDGKTVIDTTNPIDDTVAPKNGVLSFFTGPNQSLMERLQDAAPLAHFVKAFSCIGSPLMIDPQLPEKPTMFICGNNTEAKRTVSLLLNEVGHDVEDCGKVEAARGIEPLCILWCIPGFVQNDWFHAFRMVRPAKPLDEL